MRMVVFLAVVFVLLGGFKVESRAEACSGSNFYPLNDSLARSDIVVRADVIASDAIMQNGYLRVEEYLVGGSGPEYLLIEQLAPARATEIFYGLSIYP